VLRGNSIEPEALLLKISELCHLVEKQDGAKIKEKLKEIVPEYQISPENFKSLAGKKPGGAEQNSPCSSLSL